MATLQPRTPTADRSVTESIRVPPADPRDIHLSYAHHHPCTPGPATVRTWHIHADIRYDNVRLADEDLTGHVGDIHVLTLTPDTADYPWRDTHPATAHPHPVAAAVLDPTTARITRELTRQIGRRRGHHQTLILDYVELTPPWRGFGLGTLLAGQAIKTLSPGCRIAACYPAPPPHPNASHRDPVEVQLAHATLAATFQQLGFEHYQDGIFILALTTNELDQALAHLSSQMHPSALNSTSPTAS